MDPLGPATGKRLDGWKKVAAYFNRDRTTVMRWARERSLPIHRMPGGKQGSIFAFEHELAAWALRQDDIATSPEEDAGTPVRLPEPGPADPMQAPRRRPAWLGRVASGVVALVLLGFTTIAWQQTSQPAQGTGAPRAISLPKDPAVAADYVTARDLWARRSGADLNRAIGLYQSVIRREPHFAPAHAGLAEAWLLIREYGAVNDPTAYRHARRHAEEALRIDPELPSAYRALGFIDYWWSGKAPSAVENFQRAIALDGRDAQSHFWYANVLADLGEDQSAQREYDKARLLSPGSRTIEVEQACSHWQAGRDRKALEQLEGLAQRAPDDATVYNCLAWLHISRGDIVGYSRAFSARARLQGEPHLLRAASAIDAAVRRDPDTAVAELIAQSRREIAVGARKLRDTPAFFASAMGDRAALVELLHEANDLGEKWYSAPVTRRIAARWKEDAEVQRLLEPLLPAAPMASRS